MGFGKIRHIKPLPTQESLLEYLTEVQIFEFYLGKKIPNRRFNSPFREEKNPSFSIFYSEKSGRVLYMDFATKDVGDCFVFAMRMSGLSSFRDVFCMIAKDFNLVQFEWKQFGSNSHIYSLPTSNSKLVKKSSNKNLSKKKVPIQVKLRKWKIKDKDYWQGKYGLTKEQLEYCKIYPISHFKLFDSWHVADSLAYVFVEEKDGVQTYKIYQPLSDKETKWYNNNNYSVWELWNQLPDRGECLIITSSRKDAIVIKTLFNSSTITSCSLQSEGVSPKAKVVEELKNRFKEIFVLYDNDFNSKRNNGRIAGEKMELATGFLQIEIPEKYKVKDPSDFIEKYGKETLRTLILELVKNRLREEELKQIL